FHLLIVELAECHGSADAGGRAQPLRVTVPVPRDDGIRCAQDARRRAVVLLQCDNLRAREMTLELEDVADVGTAERVDRLVIVADYTEIAPRACKEACQVELHTVRVLDRKSTRLNSSHVKNSYAVFC